MIETDVVACAGRGSVRIERRSIRHPARGEALLRVRRTALCGTDLFKIAAGSEAEGSVLGHEVVATIEEIGDGVERFEPGDRVVVAHHLPCGACTLCRGGSETMCPSFSRNVLSPGGFAGHLLVDEEGVARAMYRIPDHVTDEMAVFVEPAGCVIRGIRRAGLLDRDPARSPASCIIFGGGSMGLLHLAVLRALDPGMRIAVCDPIEARRTLAQRLGAEAICSPHDAVDCARELGGGDGVEVAFDTVGGAAALDQMLSSVRKGGTAILFAHAQAGERGDFDLNAFFKAEKRLVATYSGTPDDRHRALELIAGGRLDPSPLITHQIPLAQFSDAVALMRSNEALKILFIPQEAR